MALQEIYVQISSLESGAGVPYLAPGHSRHDTPFLRCLVFLFFHKVPRREFMKWRNRVWYVGNCRQSPRSLRHRNGSLFFLSARPEERQAKCTEWSGRMPRDVALNKTSLPTSARFSARIGVEHLGRLSTRHAQGNASPVDPALVVEGTHTTRPVDCWVAGWQAGRAGSWEGQLNVRTSYVVPAHGM